MTKWFISKTKSQLYDADPGITSYINCTLDKKKLKAQFNLFYF